MSTETQNEINVSEISANLAQVENEMAKLFDKRLELEKELSDYKKKTGNKLQFPQTVSEKKSPLEYTQDEEKMSYYSIFKEATDKIYDSYGDMLLSGLKVAYGGTEGAYAHLAAKKMFPQANLISMTDFYEAYENVEKGVCDLAVLPIENSIAGEVGTVMDLMFRGSLHVNRVCDLEIKHRLIGVKGSDLEKVTTVISHPQALSQCAKYIRKHNLKTETAANTSAAASEVLKRNDPTVAAIGSKESADNHGLEILDSSVCSFDSNTTRFAVFSRTPAVHTKSASKSQRFIIVFTVRNEAGALATTLNIIGAHNYNMLSLRSRPLENLAWKYYFFIEAEGDIHTAEGESMLRELSVFCGDLKLVGTYYPDVLL